MTTAARPSASAAAMQALAPTVVHFIAAPGGGGAEAMLGNLVQAMAAGRWRTVVIVMDGRPWPEAVAKLQAAGAEVYDLQAPAFLRRDTLKKLTAKLKELRPDVVQTWMHHADFVGGWCARWAGVKKVVWGIHCREIHRNPGDSDKRMALFRRLIGLSSKWVPSRIISCSAAAMEDHLPLGYPAAAMTWVPNGIDTNRFRPDATARAAVRRELGVPEKAPLVGFIGRFHEMKNLATWLQAASLLQKRKPETHFWLCGGPVADLEPAARASLDAMPSPEKVRFTPFRPDPQQAYPALDVFSLSSRTEACPMTLMEAMACGIPCAATDVGDCARLLEGVGKTVAVRDAEALAGAWADLLENPPDAGMLRQHAVDRFDISVAARGYESVYEEVLNS